MPNLKLFNNLLANVQNCTGKPWFVWVFIVHYPDYDFYV
jgi:hypothetical protein